MKRCMIVCGLLVLAVTVATAAYAVDKNTPPTSGDWVCWHRAHPPVDGGAACGTYGWHKDRRTAAAASKDLCGSVCGSVCTLEYCAKVD